MAPTVTAYAASEALSVLAACNLKELHLKRADGSRMLDALYTTCLAARLIPDGPRGSPRERYQAVFDAALNGGLGLWILDYVEVVCADRHLTSNDPLEAYLLDGGFVKAWAESRLEHAEATVSTALGTDMDFVAFQSSQLQQQLSQMHVLVSVLRSLDRIRAVAAGGIGGAVGATAAGTAAAAAAAAAVALTSGAGHDRLSVKAELQRALRLKQALQVMDWCARHGLVGPNYDSGRYLSYLERAMKASQRSTRFRNSLLESLHLSRSDYPASSTAHILKKILIDVKAVDATTRLNKLALITYYFMDSGVLDSVGWSGGILAGAGSSGTAAAAAAAGPWGEKLEKALEDLRRTFRLSSADVGVWQCYYLLDCARGGPDDAYLARACALLPSYVTETTPFAFIERLLELGRPDIALVVDRGRFGSEGGAAGWEAATSTLSTATATAASSSPSHAPSGSGSGSRRSCRSLAQAKTLMDVRLRCGLMTEAFMLLRHHTAELLAEGRSPEELRTQTRALLRHLADWAAEEDEHGAKGTRGYTAGAAAGGAAGGGGWLNHLTELPLNATEERVLVEWMIERVDTESGAFAPLFFLQRGRIVEAVAAWKRYVGVRPVLPFSERPPVRQLLDAVVDAEASSALPLSLRTVAVEIPPTACSETAYDVYKLLDLAPGQGAASILAGLELKSAEEVVEPEVLSFHGSEPPPFITRVVQLSTTSPTAMSPAPPPAAAAADSGAGAAAASTGGVASRGSSGGSGDAPGHLVTAQVPKPTARRQPQAPFGAMYLQIPSKAPFRTPPATPAMDGIGPLLRPSQPSALLAAGGGGGLLFNIGPGALQTTSHAPAIGTAGGRGGGGDGRIYKRAKISDWM